MSLRFSPAGRSHRFSRQFFFFLFPLLISFVTGCRAEKQEDNKQITELQQSVKQLSEENQRLLKEVQTLREEIKQPQTDTTTVETLPEPVEQITMEQMKTEVEPVLKDVIDKIKKTAETPHKENQYGMRIEYDLKNAVYGLVNSQTDGQPSAKVIVKYERFLESGENSKSYGTGSSTFIFAHHNDQWVLQSYN